MSIGEFLQAVIEWFYEFWPFRIVKEWEQGVRLRTGNVTKLLTSTNGWWESGLHSFWPIFGEIISEETNVRVIETTWQTLTTADFHAVSFSFAARYKIHNLAKMYVAIHDPEDTVQLQLGAAASIAIRGIQAEDLDEKLAPAVREVAKKRLSDWGVSLLEVSLLNRVEAPTLRLLSE